MRALRGMASGGCTSDWWSSGVLVHKQYGGVPWSNASWLRGTGHWVRRLCRSRTLDRARCRVQAVINRYAWAVGRAARATFLAPQLDTMRQSDSSWRDC